MRATFARTLFVGTTAIAIGCSDAPPSYTRSTASPSTPASTPAVSAGDGPASPAAIIHNPLPRAVQTGKGQFMVPGKAFADGRDLEARPALTVMRINVWDAVARRQRVCQVTHGDELEVLTAQRHEGEERYYFQIRSGQCSGWPPETFVSRKKEPTVGDRM